MLQKLLLPLLQKLEPLVLLPLLALSADGTVKEALLVTRGALLSMLLLLLVVVVAVVHRYAAHTEDRQA
jgi:hypothetical protein